MTNKLYVGIDVHKEIHVAALVPSTMARREPSAWCKSQVVKVQNTLQSYSELEQTMRRHASAEDTLVALDFTGGHYSEPLVHFLLTRGYRIFHLEPKALKAARDRVLDQESKNDQIDARSSAYLLFLREEHGLSFRIGSSSPELDSQATVLHSLTMQRQLFIKLAGQTINRLRQILHAVFPEAETHYFTYLLRIAELYPTPADMRAHPKLEGIRMLRKKAKSEILQLASESVGVPSERYRWLILELITSKKEIAARADALEARIKTVVEQHPYGTILLSFPGINYIIAATLIGVIKDIERWPNKKKLRKAMGVYSALQQSGTSLNRQRMGKEGSRETRRVLFQVAMVDINPRMKDNDFRDYYKAQVSKGKPKMKALVATMGKIIEILFHCLKNNEPYTYRGIYSLKDESILTAEKDTSSIQTID